ncbi:MAG: DNA cytosine methyltransferase [Minisyncoccales bacterium]
MGRDKLNFKPDIIIGVPVCSALSSLNQKSSSDYCSIDNIYQLSEFSLETKPKVAIFENAPGLFSKKGKPVREKLYNISKKFGYKLSILNTDTRLHGIPQRRIRTYFIF